MCARCFQLLLLTVPSNIATVCVSESSARSGPKSPVEGTWRENKRPGAGCFYLEFIHLDLRTCCCPRVTSAQHDLQASLWKPAPSSSRISLTFTSSVSFCGAAFASTTLPRTSGSTSALSMCAEADAALPRTEHLSTTRACACGARASCCTCVRPRFPRLLPRARGLKRDAHPVSRATPTRCRALSQRETEIDARASFCLCVRCFQPLLLNNRLWS